MAPMYKLVSEINSSKIEWAMKMRLIRSYRVPAVANRRLTQSLECVFHDIKGERVHATIKGGDFNMFSPLLIEGRLYAVKNFVVTVNKHRYRTTSNRKQIIFLHQTRVVEVFDEKFPSLLYNFKPFNYLSIIENLNEAEMFDVIGRVVSTNNPKVINSNGAETKLMEIVLEDKQRTQMYCTLWEEYADQMEDFVRNAGPEQPILIVQFCRGKIFNDRVVLSSTYNATKLGFNVDCTEVEEFKQRFDDGSTPINAVSSVSVASASTTAEELSTDNANIRTIEQLTQDREVGSFWVLARIVSIETFGEWWYLSCRICKKKLLKEEQKFKCVGCKKSVSSGTPRYKIQVRVQDETDNALLTLWDQHCVDLIGKTVTQVLDEDQNKYDSLLPGALNCMINEQAIFYVQVKPEQITDYTGAYSVRKLTKDQILISKFSSNASQETDYISRLHQDDIEPMKEGSSEAEVTTPLKTKIKYQTTSQCIEGSVLKRKLIDEFSSTGADKKKTLMIKQEVEEDFEQE